MRFAWNSRAARWRLPGQGTRDGRRRGKELRAGTGGQERRPKKTTATYPVVSFVFPSPILPSPFSEPFYSASSTPFFRNPTQRKHPIRQVVAECSMALRVPPPNLRSMLE